MIRVGQEVIDDRIACTQPFFHFVVVIPVPCERCTCGPIWTVYASSLYDSSIAGIGIFCVRAWGDALLQPSADAALGKVFRISEKGSLFLSFKEPIAFRRIASSIARSGPAGDAQRPSSQVAERACSSGRVVGP